MPSPRAGELLIRLAYSGITFVDIHTRQGKCAESRTYPQTMPTTLGIEGAGTIEAMGDGVHEFRIGDHVACCLSWSSYAEFAFVPARRVVSVPEERPLEMAAASMFHGLTAHYLTRPRLADHLLDAATIRRRATDMFTSLLDDALCIEIAGRYTLHTVGQAHQDLESRQTVGKPLNQRQAEQAESTIPAIQCSRIDLPSTLRRHLRRIVNFSNGPGFSVR